MPDRVTEFRCCRSLNALKKWWHIYHNLYYIDVYYGSEEDTYSLV